MTLPSSVPEIPDGAFKGCTALENVKFDNTSNILGTVISASSTEMKRIGDTAFYGCTSLKNIDLSPVGRTHAIGAEAFSGCTSLVSAHIEKVTALGKGCFSGCTALLSVTTSDDKLTEIPENCFYNCTSLPAITLWDHVEKIGASAFRNCRKLQYVDGMFKVKEIGDNAFCDCKALKYLQSTSDDRENGTAYFHLPDNLESVGSNAFLHCGAEGTITIPASVTSIGVGAFCGMGSLNALAMEDDNNEKYMTEYGVLFTRPNADGQRAILAWPSKKYMGEYKVPEDIVTIFPYAFSGVDCSRFTIGEGALIAFNDWSIIINALSTSSGVLNAPRLSRKAPCGKHPSVWCAHGLHCSPGLVSRPRSLSSAASTALSTPSKLTANTGSRLPSLISVRP